MKHHAVKASRAVDSGTFSRAAATAAAAAAAAAATAAGGAAAAAAGGAAAAAAAVLVSEFWLSAPGCDTGRIEPTHATD